MRFKNRLINSNKMITLPEIVEGFKYFCRGYTTGQYNHMLKKYEFLCNKLREQRVKFRECDELGCYNTLCSHVEYLDKLSMHHSYQNLVGSLTPLLGRDYSKEIKFAEYTPRTPRELFAEFLRIFMDNISNSLRKPPTGDLDNIMGSFGKPPNHKIIFEGEKAEEKKSVEKEPEEKKSVEKEPEEKKSGDEWSKIEKTE